MFGNYDTLTFFFLTFLVIIGLPVAYAAYVSRLKHIERMAMIEKGIDVVPRNRGNGKDSLRWGIVITSLGIALSVSMYPFGFLAPRSMFPLHFGPWMIVGLLPLFFGLGLILTHYLTQEKTEQEEKLEEEKTEKSK